MTTPTDELQLLRGHDPAADLDPQPDSPTAQAIRDRIVTAATDDVPTPRRRTVGRRLVVAVATLTIATGAAAVAELGPFATEWEACHAAPSESGREVPFPQCAEFVTDRVLAEIAVDGSDFERQVLADREVTRAEYDQAAQRAAACIQEALEQAGAHGVTAEAVEDSWQLGFRYGFLMRYPADFDTSTLPWNQEHSAREMSDGGDAVGQATPLTDEMIQRDPVQRCPAEHFNRIDRIWEAQQISAQNP